MSFGGAVVALLFSVIQSAYYATQLKLFASRYADFCSTLPGLLKEVDFTHTHTHTHTHPSPTNAVF